MIICKCPFFLDEKRNSICCEALDNKEINRFIDRMKAHEMKFSTYKDKKSFQLQYCCQMNPINCTRYVSLMKKYNEK